MLVEDDGSTAAYGECRRSFGAKFGLFIFVERKSQKKLSMVIFEGWRGGVRPENRPSRDLWNVQHDQQLLVTLTSFLHVSVHTCSF